MGRAGVILSHIQSLYLTQHVGKRQVSGRHPDRRQVDDLQFHPDQAVA
ncbi:hypothetical protein ACIRST_37790 [Kitasatospora sp. NPDC101447]